MKYKMIVSDYGETLVHTGENVDIDNVNAIYKYQQRGGIFCIATGREWSSIYQKIFKCLSPLEELPVICSYGTAVVLSKSKKTIYEKHIDAYHICKVTKYLEDHGMPYSISSLNRTYTVCGTISKMMSWKKYSQQIDFSCREQMLKYIKDNGCCILKIEAYANDKINYFVNFLEMEFPKSFKYFYKNGGFIEIISADAGKGNAVLFLSNYCDVPKEKIVVVGDALNDMEMFEVAVNKVAVNNAIKSIIEASNHIIDNSGYLGISRLIKEILRG